MITIFETKNGVKLYYGEGMYITTDVNALKEALIEDLLNFPNDLQSALLARTLYNEIKDNIREIR